VSTQRTSPASSRMSATAEGITLLLAAIALAIGLLIQRYLVLHGLEDKTLKIGFGQVSFALPILLLPFVGVIVLLVSSWQYTARVPLTGPRQSVRLSPASSLRDLNAALTVCALFSWAMLLPYILGSVVFMSVLGWLSRILPSLEPGALGLVNWFSTFGGLSELTKYSFSLIAASALVSLFSTARVRRSRRTTRRP
jgi:hypothetical protein